MDILHDVLGFAAKGLIVFATIAVTVAFCVAVLRRKRPRAWLRVTPLNKQIDALGDAVRMNLMRKKDLRRFRKSRSESSASRRKLRPE